LCGVIVYSWAPVAVFGRREAMGRVIYPRELNPLLCIISRVVVHPKYRTIGLGAKIVKETLPLAPTPYVETVAVMAKYNPFFEKAGMTKVAVKKPDEKVMRAIHILDARGLESKFIASTSYNIRKLEAMTPQQLEGVYNTIANNYHPRLGKHVAEVTTWGTAFSHKGVNAQKAFAEGVRKLSIPRLAHLIRVLALLAQTSVYLIWKNPNTEVKI
jgi:ABC-type ATPase with predicted acetyltransferase domain